MVRPSTMVWGRPGASRGGGLRGLGSSGSTMLCGEALGPPCVKEVLRIFGWGTSGFPPFCVGRAWGRLVEEVLRIFGCLRFSTLLCGEALGPPC